MARVPNIEYPTRFAKDQITFKVPDGSRVYLFNLRTQFISQIAFKVGTLDTIGPAMQSTQVYNDEVDKQTENNEGPLAHDGTIRKKEKIEMRDHYMNRTFGADMYVTDGYTASEKTWIISNNVENIRFSQRICDVPHPDSSDEWGNLWYKEDQMQLTKKDYTFFADQVVYDAQLKDRFWDMKGQKHMMNIKGDSFPNWIKPDSSIRPHTDYPYTKYYNGTVYTVDFRRDHFVNYPTTKTISKTLMHSREWLRRFADKKFLILFRPNMINSQPRVLYGIPIADLRYHDSDKKR